MPVRTATLVTSVKTEERKIKSPLLIVLLTPQ